MSTANLALPGSHNLGNSLAAALAARVSELRNEAIRESLERFQGVPHRLETVRMLDGVRYVNDSKATNVNAVWYALDSFQQPIVLILGGRDKGNRYQELEAQLRSKVRAVLAIGESREQVARQVGAMVPDVVTMPTLDEAVLTARRLARRDDVVLLSPACSSFDMFEGYEQRGDVFRRLVHELP